MMNVAHFIFGVFGNATALFLFLAPVVTFKRIIKNKSTEQFSGVPYVMTLLNNLLSAWYGLPFVSPNNVLVTTINGTGAVIESVYVIVFLILAPRKQKLKIGGLLLIILSIFATVALVSVLALHGNNRKIFCGVAASVFSIIMYGSPLSIMRLVIKTKSVEYMPFLLSLFCFLCGTSWFIFGLIGRDPFVAVPNGFGTALGAMQLILYFIYYDKNKIPEEKRKTTTEHAVELGLNGNGKAHNNIQEVKPNTQPSLNGHA
ncbi:bidirectional sugar transporter SWEET1-like [Chenopodium quinoa]|uniref:bidirectional sugar transporter SWEET1-like n=1 Tax=Chenopodium quinoa TaxID=63459 RepID=UPI000B78A1E8|nr:bidirectional sugar transporter SWEET1-like [Chenopodium quinoa]